MRLMDTTNSVVQYPDRSPSGLACIEVQSKTGAFGYEFFREEVEALSAAGLLIQLELGQPVVKLLNITDVLVDAAGGIGPTATLAPAFNYLGMLTSDNEVLVPEAVVSSVLERASGTARDRLSGLLEELVRSLRFLRAVSSRHQYGSSMLRPSVHLSIDGSRLSPNVVQAREDLERELPFLRRALWWQQGVSEGAERLFNSSASDSGSPSGDVLVPLPFARILPEHEHVSQRHVERAIRSVTGASTQVGFSLSCDVGDEVMESEYAGSIALASLDAAIRYVDQRTELAL
jgi:hypothetical protein